MLLSDTRSHRYEREASAPSEEPVVLATIDAASPDTGLAPGTRLVGTDIVDTRGGRAILRTAGALIHLDTATRVALGTPAADLRHDPRDGRLDLRLERGAIYVDVESGDGVAVHTPFGVAQDIGTRFEVRVTGEATDIRVREGTVELSVAEPSSTEDRRVWTAEAGTAMRVTSSGVERGEVSVHDSAWSWTLQLLPAFDADGRSVDDLLRWSAERALLDLRYEDPRLETAASATILHGSIAGLSFHDSLRLTLAGSGLGVEHSVENGELRILRAR